MNNGSDSVSREIFKSVIESSVDLTIITDAEGITIYVSPQCSDVIGYNDDDILGKIMPDFIHPDDKERCREAWERVMAGESLQHYEYRIFDKKEKLRWLSHSAKYALAGEKFAGLQNIISDITGRKLAEEKLKESEERYRTLSFNIPGMLYRGKSDWSAEIVSNSQMLCGYPREKFNNHQINWVDLIHPDDRQRVFEKGSTLAKIQTTIVQEYRIITKDGSIRWVNDHKSSIFKEDGSFMGVDGIVCDVTERKQAEEDLREERHFAESIIDTAQAIILVLDIQGRIVRYNKYMEDISGYKFEETRGKDWFSTFLPQGDHDRVRELFKRSVGDMQTPGNVNSIVCKDGQQRDIEWYDRTLKDSTGNVIGLLAIGLDITERRNAEAALKESEVKLFQTSKLATLGEMAAGMAHEINQPLGGISFISQNLTKLKEKGLISEKDIEDGLNDINSCVKRLSKIINHIRTFARQDTLEIENVDVNNTINNALVILSEQLRLHSIQLDLNTQSDLPEIVGEPYQLEQVWINLMTNAKDGLDGKERIISEGKLSITDYRKTLSISTAYNETNNSIEVSFNDNGIGMEAEQKNKAFEPFYTTKKVGESTGLGLSISYGIVQSHKGKIDIVSERFNGAIIKVSLPVKSQ